MLSVILPVYNLAAEIRGNLAKVGSVLDRAGVDYELIPVDDGSDDGSAAELAAAASLPICPIMAV